MTAVNLHCTDSYGVLLYDLQSEYASSLFKQWSVQARLAHGVRMETHTRVVLTSYMQIRYDKSYSEFNMSLKRNVINLLTAYVFPEGSHPSHTFSYYT